LQIAWGEGLDLVAVAPAATPPVCRLLNYGKYRYEQSKKERKAKQGQKIGLLKEVRFRPKIEEHDLQVKVGTVRKLLEEGSKVKVSVRFRGREIIYPEQGWSVLQKVAEAMKGMAVVSNSVDKGRNVSLVLSPISAGKSKEAKVDAKT
jgi:translation initiation factor IF-3